MVCTYTYQYVVTFSATLLLLASGFALGWSSPALPKLRSSESPVLVTSDESAWIVAFMEIGVLLAALPAVWLMDRIGRKRTLVAGIVPLAVSWCLIATARNVATLCAARLLSGLTFGLGLSVVPIYLGEIAAARIRGQLAVMVTVSVQLGVLLVYALGTVAPTFAALAWYSAVPLGLFGCSAIAWLPETPYWLMCRGRDEEALAVLRRLSGGMPIDVEWRRLRESLDDTQHHGTFSEIVHVHVNRRALTIIVLVTAIQVLCGSLTTIAYAETIFAGVTTDGDGQINAGLVSVIFGSVQLIAATVSAIMVDRLGRRPLLMTSVVGTTLCNAFVGTCLHLTEHWSVKLAWWLPSAAIMLGVVFYFVGLATVIFALLAELLPLRLRRVGAAVYTLQSGVLIFTVNKLFQVVSDGWGRDVAFWGFAVCGLVFTPIVAACVPETKGREVEDIRAELAQGTKLWSRRVRQP